MRSNQIEVLKKKLKLTDVQRELMIGKILGDGHLETQNQGKTYRLKIEHGIKQKEYVDWFYSYFKDWVLTPPKIRDSKRSSKIHEKYWFNTISHSSFRFYAHQFYKNGVKGIPILIRKFLTPRVLAVWFMDDGSIKSKETKALILNTHSFSKGDLQVLIEAINSKFGILMRIRKQKDGNQLYIPSAEVDKFISIINPHVIDSMRYKFEKVKLTKVPKE
jgi:hypothetical protein